MQSTFSENDGAPVNHAIRNGAVLWQDGLQPEREKPNIWFVQLRLFKKLKSDI